MSAREQILGRVRAALQHRDGHEPPPRPTAAVSPTAPTTTTAERVQRFVTRLDAVGGRFEHAPTDAAVLTVVMTALQQHGARLVALGGGTECAALTSLLTANGYTCLPAASSTDELFAADAGITAAQWGVAETGSIALIADAAIARRASLVPPLHIALLSTRRLLVDLDELLAGLSRPLTHAVTLITGPSRTADIELQLVVGVHGPRDLLVVLTP